MEPILINGHTRGLTFLKFNRDGSLLFSTSKDSTPAVWMSKTGEQLGSYNGHNGTVWTLDVSPDTQFLLTASGDASVKLWEALTGVLLFTWELSGPARAVAFDEGCNRFAVTSDVFNGEPSAISVFAFNKESPRDQSVEPLMRVSNPADPRERYVRMCWGPCNDFLLVATEKGLLRKVNPTNGSTEAEVRAHDKEHGLMDLQFNATKTLAFTCGHDKLMKVWDAQMLRLVKTIKSAGPLNTCAPSPLKDHILSGGGQKAVDVTTTAAGAGKFEARIFHLIHGDEIGRIKGHFGPLNYGAWHPNGLMYATGGEDGYVRIQNLEQIREEYEALGEDEDLRAADVAQAVEDEMDFEDVEELIKQEEERVLGQDVEL